MEVRAVTKYVRLSPSKARDLARAITGLPVEEALKLTQHSERKAAFYIGKTLKSAVANAENNAEVSAENLYVRQAVVDQGPVLNRHWYGARGMWKPISRKTSHIKITLTDEGTSSK